MKLDEAFDNFRRGFESDRLAQAYIIVGLTHGDGRDLVEKALGLIFCTATEKLCGLCRSCRQVEDHTHPDILWVEPQMKSRKISIEQVRNLQRRVFYTSFSGGWKACVLVCADRLGAEASNAFLKTLEEPPGKSIFFLLTDSPQFLLPTIVSRCQCITVSGDESRLPDVWRESIVDILTDSGPDNIVAAFARSDRLVRLLKEIKNAAQEEESAIAAARALDEDDGTLNARTNSRYREIRTGIMRFVLLWYRDILLLVCGADDNVVCNISYLDFMKEKVNGMTYRQAFRNVAFVEAMNHQLERNLPEGPVLSSGFCRLV